MARFKSWFLRVGFPLIFLAGIGSCALILNGCMTINVTVDGCGHTISVSTEKAVDAGGGNSIPVSVVP